MPRKNNTLPHDGRPKVVYEPNPSSIPFHESPATVKAICGPVGSGKTSATCWELFFLCQESTVPVRALILRESYRQLHDSTRKTWEWWFGSASQYLKQDELIRLTIPNVYGDVLTHEIHFRHARRVEDASQFLSTEYGFIWLEECVPAFERDKGVIGGGLPKGVFDIAQMRQRQPGLHRLELVCTFNPPSKYHWTFDTFFKPSPEELARKGYALFRQPAKENEANLPVGYYDALEERLDPDLMRRFVLGEVVTMYPGERVFPAFYEQVHFRADLTPAKDVPLVIGFDFGLTPVALICQVLPNGCLRVYREVQMMNAGIERLIDVLKGVLRDEFPTNTRWRCWGDPAGAARAQTDERTCFEILSHHGFATMPGAMQFAARREAVHQRCERFIDGSPGIVIDSQRCPILCEGLLGGYRYPRASTGQLMGTPLKNQFSHVCDALQYLCTGEFNVVTGESKQDGKARIPVYNPLDDSPARSTTTWMST